MSRYLAVYPLVIKDGLREKPALTDDFSVLSGNSPGATIQHLSIQWNVLMRSYDPRKMDQATIYIPTASKKHE